MSQAAKAREHDRQARARLRVLHDCEQVTRNVSQTYRFFGISRSLFYWPASATVPEGRATTPSRRPPTSSP